MDKVDFEDVFDEDEDLDEVISMIRYDEFEGATNVKDELNYNEGWYNYSTVTFDYEGKRYSIEYKEHTSDNVSDMEYLYNTFVCLGEAKEMDETVSKEDLARIRFGYEKRISGLEEELKRKREELKVLNLLKPLSYKQLKTLGNLFLDNRSEEPTFVERRLGEFFTEMSNRK